MRKKTNVSFLLGAALFAIWVYGVFSIVSTIRNDVTFQMSKTYLEPQKTALDLKVQTNSDLTNHSLVLFGFISLIWLTKAIDDTQFQFDSNSLLFFLLASWFHLSSIFTNYVWKSSLCDAYWTGTFPNALPNFQSPRLEIMSDWQFGFFALGFLGTAFFVLSLKIRPDEQPPKKVEKFLFEATGECTPAGILLKGQGQNEK